MGPLMKDLLRLFVMHIIPLLVAAAVDRGLSRHRSF